MTRFLAFAALALFAAVPARAGIADSPLPVLVAGQKTVHLYSVPGVLDTFCQDTLISCTSTSTLTQTMGVELFSDAGGAPANNATTSAASVAPGATVTYATQGGGAYGINEVFGVGLGGKGSARILSTSKSLICTAFVLDICDNVDHTYNTSTTGWALNVIAKTKQKGD